MRKGAAATHANAAKKGENELRTQSFE